MVLDRLIIKETYPIETTIREIIFRPKGINLIVDNTKGSQTDTGNSVGKTTTIKIIDLCLGARTVSELYRDNDTKSENAQVKNYLNHHKVRAELKMIDENNMRYVLGRDLFYRGKRYIDGTSYSESEYNEKLKELLFESSVNNPTFRQLIPKFLRLASYSEEGMIKYLPITVKNDDYDAIYSFLFRLYDSDIISKKKDIEEQIEECQRNIVLLERNKSIESLDFLKQSLNIVEKEIIQLEEKRNTLSYIDEYRAELDQKRKLTIQANEVQEDIEAVGFEIKELEKSKRQIRENRESIDIDALKAIYKEARRYIPDLQASFQELLDFHNSMLQNREDFIENRIKDRKILLEQCSTNLQMILLEKQKILIEVLDEGLLDDLNAINRKIEDLNIEKGEIKKAIAILEEQEKRKDELQHQLSEILDEMKGDKIENKIKKFNEIFSDYSERLYGEKYLLAYNAQWKDEGKQPVTVSALAGRTGTGKKKAVIAAFDLAYLQFSIEYGIAAPRFIIHDKLENTHIHQLRTIFEICQQIQGQFILPILRERIDKMDQSYIEETKILELSTEDKLFRI